MFYLLKLEWLKFRKNAILRVLIFFYLLGLPSLLFVGKELKDLPPPLPSNIIFFNFPTIWDWLGYLGNWLTFFCFGFMAVYMITSEFGFKTLRQNIITGMTRTKYFLSKFYFVFVLCLFATLYYAFCGYIIGTLHLGKLDFTRLFEHNIMIPRYFLMVLGYMSFGMFVGFLIRRTGIAVFVYFGYIMIIEMILRYVVHLQIWKHKSMHFYPMNMIEDLVPMPFGEQADQFMASNNFAFFLEPSEAVIGSCIYITIFLLTSYRMMLRRDL